MGVWDKIQESAKEELAFKNFLFTHKKTHMFVKSQFSHRLVYLVWLIISACWHTGVLTADIIVDIQRNNNSANAKWFIYLSNWNYVLLLVMVLWDLCVVIYANVKALYLFGTEFGGRAKMPWYLKVSWVLHVLGVDVSIVVAILYWICFDPTYFWDDYFFNAANAVFAFIHLIIGRKPTRLYHFFLPTLFFSAYIGFTRAYQRFTNEAIYTKLDWDDTLEAAKLALPLALCAGLIVHVLVYIIDNIRSCCCCPRNRDVDEVDIETPPPTPRTMARMKMENEKKKKFRMHCCRSKVDPEEDCDAEFEQARQKREEQNRTESESSH